jgi:twitching motility two-component system response regulator PilG
VQGKLSEIDIRSILQLIELGQRTGELFVEAYPVQPVATGAGIAPVLEARGARVAGRSWFGFFLNGRIIYAADAGTSLTRLTDYLRHYHRDGVLEQIATGTIATTNAPEYGYLWALLENHLLSPAQARSIIQSMVRETLFDLLSLHQGSFIFEISPALAPQLTTLEIAPLLATTMTQVQEWKQLYPLIQSPDQCPIINSPEALQQILSPITFKVFQRYANGNTSIRQISRYLNREILTVGRAIYAYLQKGVIQMIDLPPETDGGDSFAKPGRTRDRVLWQQVRSPRIVCIDDGVTIRETVERILNHQGYKATTIENPLDALSLVFQIKPDLILCDIAMPELDGYEICAMLRKSTAFRQIPIVMLTGKDGFIDRVKARMVGATDYLTKPFGENELLMLVEKYVGPGYPDRQSTHPSAVNSPENSIEIGQSDSSSSPSPSFN